jgi:hypothetical protein
MDNRFSLEELNQFTGSEQFFRYWGSRKLVYTEGIKYLAEKAKCCWLIDEIGLVLFPKLLKNHIDSFYKIEFKVGADHSAHIIIDDGNGNTYLRHKINWTDFPVSEELVIFYLCESDDHYCLMLPSEY